MLYRVRTGDILLCEDKCNSKTQMYLITYDSLDGYTLTCLSCGGKVGSYKYDKDLLLKDLKDFLNVIGIIPKEVLAEFIEKQYRTRLPIQCHDILEEHELGIEIEL